MINHEMRHAKHPIFWWNIKVVCGFILIAGVCLRYLVNFPEPLMYIPAVFGQASIGEIMEGSFGAANLEGLWDYSSAKTLVMFCNGMWCGQSPNNIKNLLKFGYPADKIKWYRGGMQNWEILGLTTAKAVN